jgi:peptidoglycan hydrolase CwlO-like protein
MVEHDRNDCKETHSRGFGWRSGSDDPMGSSMARFQRAATPRTYGKQPGVPFSFENFPRRIPTFSKSRFNPRELPTRNERRSGGPPLISCSSRRQKELSAMFKKLGISVASVAVCLGLLHLAGLTSYTATAWSNVSKKMRGQVPIEFEIERLRHEVAQLVPDMKKHFNTIAEEMVAVENLQKEVTTTQANLKVQKQNILTMTKDLESGNRYIKYDGREYSAERIREKLTRDFATYKICETELKTKEQLLEAKLRSLEAAREQLASLKAQKQDLEIQVAQLEADLKTVRLAQTKNKFHLDDSQLARCKATLADIRDRLKVEKIVATEEGNMTGDPIPVDKKDVSTEDLVKKVRDHLDKSDVADKN